MTRPLVSVDDLTVEFPQQVGSLKAVSGVSFSIEEGEAVGVVGESGSGKTMLSLALLGLVPPPGRVQGSSQIVWNGEALQSEDEFRRVRGRLASMVFQEPMTALNPVQRVGRQIEEMLLRRGVRDRAERVAQVHRLLGEVGIGNPEARAKVYPHELSGGMRQRAMIAMALAAEPALLIADEPTTALDVTVQAQILDLLRQEREDRKLALLLVTHDLGVMAELCDRVLVMEQGRIVEAGVVDQVMANPEHPYTKQLLAALPRLSSVPGPAGAPGAGDQATPVNEPDDVSPSPESDAPARFADEAPAVVASSLTVRVGDSGLEAVSDLALTVSRGEALGLVGESGCGKSTLAKALVRLVEPSGGDVFLSGTNVTALRRRELGQVRTRAQVVFQDPASSLNPRMTVAAALTEVLSVHRLGGSDPSARVRQLLELVALEPDHQHRFPHELSGGQRQRVCIARALAVEPDILVCDEVTSALDVSVQAQILELLRSLQTRLGLSLLFISHDLAVVRQLCNRVAIMYLGRIVEEGPVQAVFSRPSHPYTQALLSAVPALYQGETIGQDRIILGGDPPDPLDPPSGCSFHPRCFHGGKDARCESERPSLRADVDRSRCRVACHHS